MKLPFNEAKKCVSLLDNLDMYVLKHSNIVSKKKIYFDEDITQTSIRCSSTLAK